LRSPIAATEIEFGKYHFPTFTAKEISLDDYLDELAEKV
jgi:hypothetical protein